MTSANPDFITIPTREAIVGDNLPIHRALPSRQKRLIGAWCFLDHAGPSDLPEGEEFFVGPHPHIGLQTFTWMIEGEVFHHDSLGYQQLIKPYEINLMTAGHGISHVEMSPENSQSSRIHTTQLWIALPDQYRHIDPTFEHYDNLPITEQNDCRFTVLAGEFLGQQSPVKVYSDMMGADIHALKDTVLDIPLKANYEYGILVLQGELKIGEQTIQPDTLIYLDVNQQSLSLSLNADTRLLLIGGVPFGEDIIVWWNFVARTTEEIQQAALDWTSRSDRFGLISEFDDRRLQIPTMPDNLKASH